MKTNRKNYKLWFYSEKPLEDIATEFYNKKLIEEFQYDYENVFEWIEAHSIDLSYEFNISRKHSYWSDFKEGSVEQKKENLKEPISIMLMYENIEPSDGLLEEIANQIHLTLNCSVYLGTINYLGGNDFEYIKTKEIIEN
ncbi:MULTISPECIES: hypothetical protein [Aquimarina]|uniref:hypothetical protein n=1 Tax=Aquimarina TaxID=290174 RepID=UPI000944FA25|nr:MULTISPECIES: hypothetical protein [Aquimarina]